MKRFFRLSAALAALALLSGCASLLHPRQVEDLQLIQTIGFDGGIGDMTVSVSSGEASEDAVSAQLAARGASIQTAVQRLQDFSPREELFFAHIRYAAVGEDCARGGITSILDYFERGTQTQLSVPLFVVKGESAYTLVAANGGENEITAALSSLEADTKRQGSAHCFTVLEIASRLNFIAYQEHIEIEPDAVNLLARLADGGMRDGVSLLDQCASAAGGAVTLESVYASLGLAGERRTAELIQAIAQQDTAKALTVFSSLYAAGKDVVVVGGGDTGVDCVAAALRQGARSVAQVIRAARPADACDDKLTWPVRGKTGTQGYGQREAEKLFGASGPWKPWSSWTTAPER